MSDRTYPMWIPLKQQLWRWRGVLVTVPSITGGLLLLRFAGALQLMELVTLDQMFRLRPVEAVDSRIVLVTIDETDIKQLGQWPMSDATLAQLISAIKQQQPRVIGLDIFRDLPIEPGHQALANVFTTTPNLIGIENVIRAVNGEVIPAPPLLKQRDQVSASDLLLDRDGRVRRNLLYLRTQDDRSIFTLGARLAFFYLDKQGVYRQPLNPEQTTFRLGQAIFTPLQPNDGGYVGMDAGGYQILSNFPKFQPGVHTIALTDVLQGLLPRDLVRDRIVLIGVTAESLKDKFFTSYTIDSTTVPAGVEVHALLASQLLSAALDGRPLLHTWSEPMESLWIVVWSTIGAVIGWTASSPRQTVLKVVMLGILLCSGAYSVFLIGWWVIIVPPLLALVGSAITSNGYLLWDNLKEYARTLEHKVEERTLNLEQEIVERKQAEATLSQQKQLLQTIVDHIPVMITLYDAMGHIEFVNHQFEQILGWSSADLQNIDLVAECSADAAQRQQLLDHMLAATGTWLDLKIRTKDDRFVNTAWANVQLDNHLFVGIGQDITDRKRAEEASLLDERNRMAREIHDVLAQSFTGILLHVGAALEILVKKPAKAETHLETVDELARSGLAEARRSVVALRPKLLEEGDLSSALKQLTAQMQVSSQTQLTCEIMGVAYTLAPHIENHILRIGQEALTNAVKYAHAATIHMELVYEETHCLLRIKDDGQGFDVSQVSLEQGFGLIGMSERAEQMNGELIIQSQPGQGTEIVVIVGV